jgi:hypothetical protein
MEVSSGDFNGEPIVLNQVMPREKAATVAVDGDRPCLFLECVVQSIVARDGQRHCLLDARAATPLCALVVGMGSLGHGA